MERETCYTFLSLKWSEYAEFRPHTDAPKKRGGSAVNRKFSRMLRPGLSVYLAILIVCAAVALFFREYYLAVFEAGGALVLLVYALVHSKNRRRALTAHIMDVENALTASTHSESPVPKVIISQETGEIVWASKAFIEMVGMREELPCAPISSILPELTADVISEALLRSIPEITFRGKRYHVYGSTFSDRNEGVITQFATIFLIDMTEYLNVREEYVRSRPVVSIILVDNYDELTRNMTDNDISALTVAINNAIQRWVAGKGGLLRRLERNRYLFIFESQFLQGMTEQNFSLLKEMRHVVNGAGVQATVSIGVGRDGSSYEEALSFAALSIEMALSRGGDQAVVKDRYNFSFFGGRGRESDSPSKVRSRVMAGSLSELIAQSTHIFVMGHANADLDTLGAAAGVQAICRKRGKTAHIVIDYQQNAVQAALDRFAELPEYRDCFLSGESALILADAKSLLILVDTNRPDQVQYQPLLNSMSRVVVIDHHRRAADYVEQVVLNIHEPSASSACELVAELLQYVVEPRDVLPEEANALLSGIVLDTKHFSVRTNSGTFEAAAFLRRLGADTVEVKKLLQRDFPTTVARYRIVQEARIYRSEIAIAVLDSDVGRVTAAQAADELVNISNIAASFVIFPSADRVVISARSIGEANVQVILEPLGGGGNPATAGAQIAETNVQSVVERLVASIDRFYEQISQRDGINKEETK